MKKPFGKHGDGTIFQREGIFDWDYKIGAFRTGLERDKDCKTGQAFVFTILEVHSCQLPFMFSSDSGSYKGSYFQIAGQK